MGKNNLPDVFDQVDHIIKNYSLSALKDEIDSELSKSRNKMEVLEMAYLSLEGSIEQMKINNVRLVLASYNANYRNSFEIDETQKKYTERELLFISHGKMLADYHAYLDKLKSEFRSSNTKDNRFTII